MRFFLLFFQLLFCIAFVRAQSVTTIEGYAPLYVGEKVAVYFIDDYLSMTKRKVGETKVKSDSTFSLTIFNDQTRKVSLTVAKDFFDIYIAPNSTYDLFVKGPSKYNAYNPNGNEMEFFFGGLDSTDVNYNIIHFEEDLMNFLEANYTHQKRSSGEFVKLLDDFKTIASETYASDTSQYFKTYVKFAIASLDNLSFKGNRNRYEKYDFYLKPETVFYQNDRYMQYVLKYYDKYADQLSKPMNQAFYDGVVASSPTLLMQVLGKDYALDNVRLRELVMMKMLTDIYYNNEYPQTNVIKILDSLSNHSLFSAHAPIALNLKNRLTDLVQGSKMADFQVKIKDELMGLSDFTGKHLYISFIRVGSEKSERDFTLLKPLYQKYGKYVEFLTLLVDEGNELHGDKLIHYIDENELTWPVAHVNQEHQVIKVTKVVSFPHYILLDKYGYVVANPALSPRPNNEYETIERLFFTLEKVLKAKEAE